jgi:surface antigen
MVALAATLIAQFAAVTPANAWTTTCTDSGCPNSAAWDSARWTSWWGNHVTGSSTAGANCTNYAAWKLSQNGVSRVDGLGNAQDWDDRARAVNIPVNHSPAVGAIAQWNGGGLGHLAYVEEVHGATVIVSESNWSGHWLHRREMPASEVENFIHFKDVGSVTALAPAPVTSTKAIGTPDFDGDGFADVFGVSPDGVLYLYRGNGDGGWATGSGTAVGSGWSAFSYVIAPGDFNGGGRSDVIGITRDGTMRLYTGNGTGGWADGSGVQIGSGWTGLRAAFSPGDFTGDPHHDIIAVRTDGSMHVYAGNGAGGWATGSGTAIGSGWNTAKAVFSPGDFNADGKSDVLGVANDGTLTLYTGNRAGGFANGAGIGIGTGWGTFKALTSPGDFTKDATSDVLGVGPDGAMYLYRGNGTGGWLTGNAELIGSGF